MSAVSDNQASGTEPQPTGGKSEAELFFGREHFVQQLLGGLVRARIVILTGPSGCGKSSLVRVPRGAHIV